MLQEIKKYKLMNLYAERGHKVAFWDVKECVYVCVCVCVCVCVELYTSDLYTLFYINYFTIFRKLKTKGKYILTSLSHF